MLEKAKDKNRLTHVNWNYYEQEAIETLPSILNLLIDARVEDLQYNLRIYETCPTTTKTENGFLYTKFCLNILNINEEDYYELDDENKKNLIDKSYLFSFLFYSKKVTEIVLKKLIDQGYKVSVLTEVIESGDEYKYLEISWDDESLNS